MKIKTFKKLLRWYFFFEQDDVEKNTLKERWTKFRVRSDRGTGLIGFLTGPGVLVGLGAIIGGFTVAFSGWWLVGGVFLWFWGTYTLGFLDIIFGFLQSQRRHLTLLDPIHKENWENIREILRRLKD